jgi:alcohol dehydrogenase class IV
MVLDIKTKIISGRTKKESLFSNLEKKSRRVLLVADPSADQSLIKAISDNFTRNGSDCVVFSDIPVKPTSRVIENICEVLNKGYVETIAAAGGVKTLNIAKTAAAVAMTGISVDDLIDALSVPESFHVNNRKIEYIEIPTSLRNPLMFTPYSMIVDGRNRSVKYINTAVLPSIVINDPDFYDNLPTGMYDSVIFEIMLNCLEGLSGKKRCYFSDILFKSCLTTLIKPEGVLNSDRASEVALSSCIALSVTGPGIGFFLSSFLNSRSSVSKAVASAILLPYILEWYIMRYPLIIDIVNEIISPPEKLSAEELVQFFRRKISMKGIPLRLSEVGINRDIFSYAASGISTLNTGLSLPSDISEDEVLDILKKAF